MNLAQGQLIQSAGQILSISDKEGLFYPRPVFFVLSNQHEIYAHKPKLQQLKALPRQECYRNYEVYALIISDILRTSSSLRKEKSHE